MPSPGSEPEQLRVLFVCLGNICRSPLAEGVFLHHARSRDAVPRVSADSAGTGGWHEGEAPDPRSRAVAEQNGVRLEGAARKVRESDFHEFDLILAMDRDNLRELERLQQKAGGRAELRLFREFDPDVGAGLDRQAFSDGESELDVPDPYYGGADGFTTVYRMVDRTSRSLLDSLLGDG